MSISRKYKSSFSDGGMASWKIICITYITCTVVWSLSSIRISVWCYSKLSRYGYGVSCYGDWQLYTFVCFKMCLCSLFTHIYNTL